ADFHAVRLNRDRPLWEAHLVEGLEDGRFALCTKMHHSQFDGVNMGRHLLGGLSPDAGDRNGTAPWVITRRPRRGAAADAATQTLTAPPEEEGGWLSSLASQVGEVASQVGSQVSGVASAIGGTVKV